MWTAILNISGWASFYLLILFYVRWIIREHAFFAGADPENWKGPWEAAQSSPDRRSHLPVMGSPLSSAVIHG